MREHPWLILVVLFMGCTLYTYNVSAACPGTDCSDTTCLYGETGTCRVVTNLTLSSIQATVNAAVAGSSSTTNYVSGVYLPSGTGSISGAINISGKHGIVIAGQGSGSTTLNGTSSGVIYAASPATNNIRVTGIHMHAPSGYIVFLKSQRARIDHNLFTGGSASAGGFGVYFYDGYHNTGVIDRNTFTMDTYSTIIQVMDNGAGSGAGESDVATYATPIDWGSSDWVFVEGNTINANNSALETIESNMGGKIVARWNTINGNWYWLSEQHNTDAQFAPGNGVGSRAHEFYYNLMKPAAGTTGALGITRAGTAMFYGNVYDVSSGARGNPDHYVISYRAYSDCTSGSTSNTAAPSVLTNGLARCCSSSYTSGSLRGEGYPCVGAPGVGLVRGGVFTMEPLYFWGNKRTTNGTTMVDYNPPYTDPSAAWALQANRDWCTGTTKPASCGGKALTYTPYTCPHPLTGYTGTCDTGVAGAAGYNVAGTAVAPPGNLRILQ